jgi:quinol monooxygenase YgiN
MSYLIVMKVRGDVATFKRAMDERADELKASAERARAAGAIHHRFGIADGAVVVVDEWDNPAEFEKFFTDPDMQAFVASIGGDTSTPPEMWVSEAISSPDEF